MPELRGAWQHVRDKLKGELLGVCPGVVSLYKQVVTVLNRLEHLPDLLMEQ